MKACREILYVTMCLKLFSFLPQAELEKRLCSDYPNTVFSHLVIPQRNGESLSVSSDDGKLKEDRPTKASEHEQCCGGMTCNQSPSEKVTQRTKSATKISSLHEEQEQGAASFPLKTMADALDTITVDSDEGQDAIPSHDYCR